MSHDRDYIERWRRFYYPRLHGLLNLVGLYSVGEVGPGQYVCTLKHSEEPMERRFLHNWCFSRNPLAAYKSHREDGRQSTLSIRLRHKAAERCFDGGYIEPGMQLHLTWLRHPKNQWVDVYAHYEDDWEVSPLKHLQGENVSYKAGVEKARRFIRNETDLQHGEDYVIYDAR